MLEILLIFKKPYIVVLYHPVTTNFDKSNNTKKLLKVCRELNIQVIWFWPNVDSGSNLISKSIRTYREKIKY